MKRALVVGNWKMQGTAQELAEARELASLPFSQSIQVVVCPPATLLHRMSKVFEGTRLSTGGQDCHTRESGAHTGDISAAMLLDAGAEYVIIGHSERRQDHGETSADARTKALAARKSGLAAIICIGETELERDSNIELDIVGTQLQESVPENSNGNYLAIAYEPVWAIGTGRTPSITDIERVHGFARDRLVQRFGKSDGNSMKLLYGGSVKPDNAAAISKARNVDGCLVGGASLQATSFAAIAEAFG